LGDFVDTDARALRVDVLGLFIKGRYSDLDALAAQLRSRQLRFAGGGWKLYTFYDAVSSPGSATATDAEWNAHIATLQDWISRDPESPTPRVALARTYLRFAWKARGHGYAETVTPEGWASFRDRVQAARTALEQSPSAALCPEWFLEMQGVALTQEWSRAQVDALVDRALAYEPKYFYFATAEANYLLPKWHGAPGDVERFAAQVADKVGGAEGDAVYFRIAAAVNCCKRSQAPDLSWPRVQRGFAAIEQLYGSTSHQRNVMAYLALRAGDTATARAMFARIGDDWSQSVWRTKVLYDASRTGQAIAGVDPVDVEASPADLIVP
jgi:hypothetical protein